MMIKELTMWSDWQLNPCRLKSRMTAQGNSSSITSTKKKCLLVIEVKLGYYLLHKDQYSVMFSSVTQSCSTLCDPMDCSMPGLPVHHQLPELTQTHVHCVGDAIQPSHPVVPFSFCLQAFPASGSFQRSKLFTSGGQSIGVSASASVLPMNIQYWFPLGWTGWISSQSKGFSRVFSNTIFQKHQFFGTQLSLRSNSHIHTQGYSAVKSDIWANTWRKWVMHLN